MKQVIVTGDLCERVEIVPDNSTPGNSRFYKSADGASRLKEMIRVLLPDVAVTGPDVTEASPRAYSFLQRVAARKNTKERVWRTERELGIDMGGGREWQPMFEDPADPDLLVLHHQDLGFVAAEDGWPAAVRDTGSPRNVLLHLQKFTGETGIWRRLTDRFSDRLTVVLSADHLRAAGASLSYGLSWDRCIEELVREMRSGTAATSLALCGHSVVSFGTSGVAVFGHGRLERFLYDPQYVEGLWEADRPGTSLPSSLCLTAFWALHLIEPSRNPTFPAIEKALNAASSIHELGGGKGDFEAELWRAVLTGKAKGTPRKYSAAFPHDIFSEPTMHAQPEDSSNLLRDVAGWSYEYVAAKAMEVVTYGPDVALKNAPCVRFGDFFSVDRDEVERLLTIRNLVDGYRANSKDRRPLSLAVLGPAGSGKSFAIKQLAKQLFGDDALLLEFNLSQFRDWDDLVLAFHQIRDGAARGKMPFVFFDEFDAENFRWLKHFLAPMQDSEFQSAGHSFPFGKAVFVFAGSSAATMEGFSAKVQDRTDLKGPDFLSRLRGYVDIKGPNALPKCSLVPSETGDCEKSVEDTSPDFAHLIRRAVMLRAALSRYHEAVIDPVTGIASVSFVVVRAFLRVERFRHGARSLETVVSLCKTSPFRTLEVSGLPPSGILDLHVTQDFHLELSRAQLCGPAIEFLAQACHEAWYSIRKGQQWSYGATRNDELKQHPWFVPYVQLPPDGLERNRLTARVTAAKLQSIGYAIEKNTDTSAAVELTPDELDALVRIEHDLWLSQHLLNGYAHGKLTDESLRLHADLVRFEDLVENEKAIDREIANSIVPALKRNGYRLVPLCSVT